jgi:hypothetical protein
VLLLCAGTRPALAQSSGSLGTGTTTQTPTETTPETTTTATPEPPTTTGTTPETPTTPVEPPGAPSPPLPVAPLPPSPLAPPPLAPEVLRTDPGAASAALQPKSRKLAEARGDCKRERPPINRMLAIGGVFPTEKSSSWTPLALLVAACFAAIAAAAFFIRRRGRRKGRTPAGGSGLLETLSALVAIVGTLVAIGDQVIEKRPTRQATITVRDVMPRITRSQFDRRTGNRNWRKIAPVDRREVGNVVLLEIRLTGYRGRPLDLRWGTYSLDRAVSGTLLHGTDKAAPLHVDDDHQTSFVPVWLGYPKSATFEVQFRLIEGQQIRQLASLGPMRGSKYRYACSRDVRSRAART